MSAKCRSFRTIMWWNSHRVLKIQKWAITLSSLFCHFFMIFQVQGDLFWTEYIINIMIFQNHLIVINMWWKYDENVMAQFLKISTWRLFHHIFITMVWKWVLKILLNVWFYQIVIKMCWVCDVKKNKHANWNFNFLK